MKFKKKWESVLINHPENAHKVFGARDKTLDKPCIVIVDHYVPQPDRDAGSRTIMAFISTLLKMNFNVKFWPDNLWFDPVYTPVLQQMGVEVLYGKAYKGNFEKWLQDSDGLVTHVLLSRPHIAQHYVDTLERFNNIRTVYYGHDLHFARLLNEFNLSGDSRLKSESEELYNLESSIWQKTDVVLYPSDDETTEIKSLFPSVDARTVSPYVYEGLENYYDRQPINSNKIIFVAGFGHPPNTDAAKWFVTEIFPIIKNNNPDATLFLIGSNPSVEVKELASDSILVTGYVTDEQLKEHYLSARVAVVPLRYGAGIKNKVVEAMAYGAPLVTTEVGAQGLANLNQILTISSEPNEFAQAVSNLLDDDDNWVRVSQAGIQFAEKRFSANAMMRTLSSALGVFIDEEISEEKECV
jgi:glycosyltransferase involved in cell wall biosynthesis